MPGTTARHRALRAVLEDRVVSSQRDLVGLLGKKGFDVTQATVSRDLQAVGAVKARDGAGMFRYVVANGIGKVDEAGLLLAKVLGEYARSIKVSGNLVVVMTPPGAAHVVAAAIDAFGLQGTIGTVAGDDTLLLIADEATTGRALAADLERIGAKL